jgi:hypothetical protein
MMGTFSIDYKPIIILFDSGATHSFISDKCGAQVGLDSSQVKGSYIISTPRGKISSNQLIRFVAIQLGSKVIKIDLVLLPLEGMDIILGMYWMTKHITEPLWQNKPELYRLKYASPLQRAPTYFKRYNPLACRVASR